MRTLDEEDLRRLLKELIAKRKSADAAICISCGDIHEDGSACYCDNDE